MIHNDLTSKKTENISEQNKTLESSPEIKFNIESSLFLFKRNQDLLLESKNFQDLTVAFYNSNSASFKTAKNFRNFCSNLMDLGAKKLIVDLSMCNNIDPTFAGALVVVKRALIGANGDMALVLNSKHILIESFALLNLELQFDIYSTVEIAINNFNSCKTQYTWEYAK